MDSFYIFSVILLLAGAFIGYRLGFIRILFLIITLAAATIAAYFIYPLLTGLITASFNNSESLVSPVLFSFIFLLVFVLVHFLLSSFSEAKGKNNLAILNSMAGSLTGIITGCIILLVMVRFTTVVTVPQTVEATVDLEELDDFVNPPAAWINNELVAIFKSPPVKVMASEANDSVAHEAVLLSYTTDNIELQPGFETQLLQLLNTERQQYHLKPLINDEAMKQVARAHSTDMFKRGYFSHSTPDGVDPFQRLRKAKIRYRLAGENLALAQTVLQAHQELMRSPGHRANILNPAYGRVGVGILKSGVHGLMITEEFRD